MSTNTSLAVHESDRPSPHRHLPVAANAGGDVGRRLLVVASSVAAAALFAWSLGMPWWVLKLYAPQYPKGLTLIISLKGLAGDVHEIDMLNHYIGMAHLGEAAQLERAHAAEGVGVVAFLVIAMTLFAGKKLGRLIVLAGAAFPVGFVLDSMYWMHRFGHELDPHAPLHVPTFTPQLFGNGSIGQFMTFAEPAAGFWVALSGVALLVCLVLVRERVCAGCARAGACSGVCKRGFVVPERNA